MQLNEQTRFANIEDDIVLKLRKRYESVHPLLFLRSVEKAETVSELFDILDTIPEPPLAWSEDDRCWVTVMGSLLSNN